MNKTLIAVLFIMFLAGCTANPSNNQTNNDNTNNEIPYEPSKLTILSVIPDEYSTVAWDTVMSIEYYYWIGNYNSSEEYSVSISIQLSDPDHSLVETSENATHQSGTSTFNFYPTLLSLNDSYTFSNPYAFELTLSKRTPEGYYLTLANQTLYYNQE